MHGDILKATVKLLVYNDFGDGPFMTCCPGSLHSNLNDNSIIVKIFHMLLQNARQLDFKSDIWIANCNDEIQSFI